MPQFKPIEPKNFPNDFNDDFDFADELGVEELPRKRSLVLLLALTIICLIFLGLSFFLIRQKNSHFLKTIEKKISIANKKSCSVIRIPNISGTATLCLPASIDKGITVVAVGGWGSVAQQTEKVCRLFNAEGWPCLALDSAGNKRSEEMVIENIKTAVGYLKANKKINSQRIVLWGGSNGARTTLLAAAEAPIFAELALSPPLFFDLDKTEALKLKKLNCHLFYIFGENDYTDKQTAQALMRTVKQHNKTGQYKIIAGAGHEICCYNPVLIKEQIDFVEKLIK